MTEAAKENVQAPEGTTETPGAVAAAAAAAGGTKVLAPEWVPVELREHKSLTKFKTPSDLAQSYVNLEKMVGNRVEIPGEDAPAEAKQAWRDRIGVPKTAAEYEAPAVPEGINLDQKVLGAANGKFHEIGLTKSQAKKLGDWYIEQQIESTNEFLRTRSEENEAGMKALETRWGVAAPRQIALCQRVVAELGGAEVKKVLDETGAGNSPAVVEMLAKIGGMMEEDNLIMPVQVGQTREQALTEIAAIRADGMKDRKGPLMNKSHAQHKQVVQRLADLHRIAYPEMQGEDGM